MDEQYYGDAEATIISHTTEVVGVNRTPRVVLDVEVKPEGQEPFHEQVSIWLSNKSESSRMMWKRNLRVIGFLPEHDDLKLLESKPTLLAGNPLLVTCKDDGDWGYRVEIATRGKISQRVYDQLNNSLTETELDVPEDTPF